MRAARTAVPEYRQVPDDDAPAFRAVARYAFEAESGPHDPEEPLEERRRRMYAFGEERGMYDGEDLVATCQHVEFETRVRGAWLPMAGLTAVATRPERRRQGLVGEMLRESLAEYRDRGWPLSALYPFEESFYARYGWATGARYTRATVDVDSLAVVQDAASGRFRRVDPGEHEPLEPVYEDWLGGRPLATRRSADWWRDRVFQSGDGPLYGVVWERDGEPRGYLVYDVESGDEGRRLKTYEFAHRDHEAFLNLLRYCHDHDSQVADVEVYGPTVDRLLDVVSDRDAVEVQVGSAGMVRLVDVPAALEAVNYPADVATDLALAVVDDHAPWNEATFAVSVRDGRATVTETDVEPDAAVGVGTLSQLYVGYHSVERARQIGDLRVEREEAADALAALFPPQEPYLPEGF